MRKAVALVFAAHGDDEIIGCGGTISAWWERGVRVVVITFTNRETAYANRKDKAAAPAQAKKEMRAADKVLRCEREVWGLPNRAVTNNRETFERVVRTIRKYRPDVILTHRHGDHHRDHNAVAAMVEEARWKAWERLQPEWGKPHETPLLLRFEIMGDKIPKPHLIITFSKRHLTQKLKAMQTQVSQLPILRGIEQQILGSAMDRGGYVGGKGVYGEAFEISDFHPARIHLG